MMFSFRNLAQIECVQVVLIRDTRNDHWGINPVIVDVIIRRMLNFHFDISSRALVPKSRDIGNSLHILPINPALDASSRIRAKGCNVFRAAPTQVIDAQDPALID